MEPTWMESHCITLFIGRIANLKRLSCIVPNPYSFVFAAGNNQLLADTYIQTCYHLLVETTYYVVKNALVVSPIKRYIHSEQLV